MPRAITISVCLSFILLTIGCGHGWKHATLPEKKWDADYADCVHRAESKAGRFLPARDSIRSLGTDGEVRYLTDQCMEGKGYYPEK